VVAGVISVVVPVPAPYTVPVVVSGVVVAGAITSGVVVAGVVITVTGTDSGACCAGPAGSLGAGAGLLLHAPVNKTIIIITGITNNFFIFSSSIIIIDYIIISKKTSR
jgi:hypothetical protein